jgi:regulator of PEP synthase PpsR (kinase-PPPase family)
MVTTKSKLKMEFNKEVTSASSGLVYVCFDSFVKWSRRANVEQFNYQCFEKSAKICEPLDVEVKKHRICGRQIMRDNVEAESPEDYFRKSITVP